jgi:hypothetical protein
VCAGIHLHLHLATFYANPYACGDSNAAGYADLDATRDADAENCANREASRHSDTEAVTFAAKKKRNQNLVRLSRHV